MSEPIKKPKQTPESYNPKTPEIANVMKETQTREADGNQVPMGEINVELPTKNFLDFNVSYNDLENVNFIQCFTTAYMYLETSTDANGNVCNPDIGGWCAGCGCSSMCKNDEAAKIRCKFFCLFNTMSGNSAIRCHFDGKPTEVQKLVGDTEEEDHGCGSDFMIDFFFQDTIIRNTPMLPLSKMRSRRPLTPVNPLSQK